MGEAPLTMRPTSMSSVATGSLVRRVGTATGIVVLPSLLALMVVLVVVLVRSSFGGGIEVVVMATTVVVTTETELVVVLDTLVDVGVGVGVVMVVGSWMCKANFKPARHGALLKEPMPSPS